MKLDELSSAFPNVDEWTDWTKKKVISVYKVMVEGAGMIEGELFKQVAVQGRYWCYFLDNNESWFLEACLFNEEQRKRIINSCT